MLLKQKRISSLKHFSTFKDKVKIKIVVNKLSRFPDQIVKFGFNIYSGVGTKILPATFNKYAFKNAEQYSTTDKSLPKEDYFQTLYWKRTEWAGRGETREVAEFTDIPRKRYHRDYHLPFSVDFTLYENDGDRFICSDEIIFSPENNDKMINTVNMLLGLFGECEIVSEQLEKEIETIHLTWDILPPGRYPWNRVKAEIEHIIAGSNNTQKQMMLRNCESIYLLDPDFKAYGKAGFKGYVVFGFKDKNIYILESVIPNNATYVFEKDWEELTKLTKAEILASKLHKARIIHNSKWEKEFNNLMGDSKWEKISM